VSDDGSESSDVSSSTNQNTSSPISLTTANFASSFLEKFTTSHGNQNNKSAVSFLLLVSVGCFVGSSRDISLWLPFPETSGKSVKMLLDTKILYLDMPV